MFGVGFIITNRWVLPLETVPVRRAGASPAENKNTFLEDFT
jgi:hypothetical protein